MLGSAFTPHALAEPGSHPCASVVESAERLACYDRAFPPPPQAAASAAALSVQRFGLAPAPSAAPPEAERLAARVVGTERSRGGDLVFVLDNGQRWRLVDRGAMTHVADGEAVQIERAVLGGFRLVTAAGVGLRVRRLP